MDKITSYRAISIRSNIAEGHSRHHGREYVQFLYVASGSLSEVEMHMELALNLAPPKARSFPAHADSGGHWTRETEQISNNLGTYERGPCFHSTEGFEQRAA